MIQCALVHAWYSLAFAMLDGARVSPSGVRVGRAIALVQATVGAASVWLPSCRFEHYVLFGGANVTPPLMTLWCTITWLSARHGLLRAWARAPLHPHPLVCGFICGFVMWAGNSAILVGRSGGLVYWAHSLFRRAGLDVAENTVEEMAIFHVFGLAGNECLFRAFLWMAEHEGRWGAVDGWLRRPALDDPARDEPSCALTEATRQPGDDRAASKAWVRCVTRVRNARAADKHPQANPHLDGVSKAKLWSFEAQERRKRLRETTGELDEEDAPDQSESAKRKRLENERKREEENSAMDCDPEI